MNTASCRVLITGRTKYLSSRLFIDRLPYLKYLMEQTTDRNVLLWELTSFETAANIVTSNTDYKNIIVDLPVDDCRSFLLNVNSSGLLSGYYHFHFTSLVCVSSKIKSFSPVRPFMMYSEPYCVIRTCGTKMAP